MTKRELVKHRKQLEAERAVLSTQVTQYTTEINQITSLLKSSCKHKQHVMLWSDVQHDHHYDEYGHEGCIICLDCDFTERAWHFKDYKVLTNPLRRFECYGLLNNSSKHVQRDYMQTWPFGFTPSKFSKKKILDHVRKQGHKIIDSGGDPFRGGKTVVSSWK